MHGAAGLGDVRLHDLRHAFASVAASRGMGLPVIGKMLVTLRRPRSRATHILRAIRWRPLPPLSPARSPRPWRVGQAIPERAGRPCCRCAEAH